MRLSAHDKVREKMVYGRNYGDFGDFCKDSGSAHSTLPVCNLFDESAARGGSGFGGCELLGIPLSGGRHLANLGGFGP